MDYEYDHEEKYYHAPEIIPTYKCSRYEYEYAENYRSAQ